MSIEHWWPRLRPSTQTWLIDNNGDAVPSELQAEIALAGGPAPSDSGPDDEREPSGFHLSDEDVDWVEAVANGEAP